jgi:hydrogenase maturation factor
MASNSAAALATQQSIKAYVDAQVTASDLDFTGDSGGAQSVDLDSQTFTIAGTANEIETSASSQTLTIGLPDDVTIGQDLTVTRNVSIADSIFHTGDTDTAIRFPAADNFTVETGGSERFRVGPTGIATFTGNVSLTAGGAERLNIAHVSGGDVLIKNPTDAYLAFGTNDSERVRITNTGDVGIGTETPETPRGNRGLEVAGTTGAEIVATRYDDNLADGDFIGAFLFKNLDAGGTPNHFAGMYAKANGTAGSMDLHFSGDRAQYEADTSDLVIRSGKVGINTNDPQGTLQINDGLNGLEFNINSNDAVVAYNRTTSSYLPVGLQGSSVQLRIGGTGTILDVEAGGTTTTGIATFSSTAHLTVPVGTTAQRASVVANGMIRYNTTLNSYEGYGNGAWGGLGGGTEIDTAVSSTSATNLTTFAHASYRSASMRIQITQGSSYQVGKYLLIHDGTTVTIVEESAIATGDMLGSISGAINGSNVEVKVTMNSASSATVTTIIDKITV